MAIVKETNINRYICDTADVASLPTGVPAGSTAIDRQTGKKYITYDGTNWTLLDNRSRLVDSGGTEVTESTGHSVNANLIAGTAVVGKVRLVDSGGTEVTEATGHSVQAKLIAGTAEIGKLGAGTALIGYVTPPSTLACGSKTVTTAGVRVALAASTTCKEVIITANAANTDYIYIGDVTVSSTVFMKKLLAGEEFSVAIDNLSKVYLDAGVSLEGVTFGYLN